MWTTTHLAWSAGVPPSRISWGQPLPSSPGRADPCGFCKLSPARQQLVPSVVPKPAASTTPALGRERVDRSAGELVVAVPAPDALGRIATSIVRPAALTPAFTGPYHRCFGAICAPDLCLPSTMTGLRESFP
jgi:hypothetical protein